MSRIADVLEREGRTVDLEQGDFERLLGRRERKQRNRRIRAGAVGVIVALVVGVVLLRSLTSDRVPADRPSEPVPAPVASGALAYAFDGDIYVADPDGSNPVKITDGSADATCERNSVYSAPSWSPDGSHLAFQRYCPSSDRLVVVMTDLHGNDVRGGQTYGWGLTWSPDSTRVAVWNDNLRLGVYGVDGERQSMPMPPGLDGGNDAAPEWMPDGSALLVWGYEVVPLDGSAGRQLTLGGHATYSPDGTRIVVVRDHSTVIMEADGSPMSEVDGQLLPVWSPDGERFASLADHDGELTVVDVASGTATVLPEARTALVGGDTILEVRGFSPEGDRILYEIGYESADRVTSTALWSIGVDGSDPGLVVVPTTDGSWRPR